MRMAWAMIVGLVGCSSSELPPFQRGPTGGTGASARLAIDANAVYWFDGTLKRQARGADEPVAMTPEGAPTQPLPIAVNATDVFFGNVEISRVPIAGGSAQHEADAVFGPAGFVVDDAHLYYPKAGVLTERSIADDTERTLDGGGSALGLALHGPDVYGTSCNASGAGDAVWRVPRGGGAHAVVTQASCPQPIVVDDTHAYFVDAPSAGVEAVYRAPLAGGPSESVVACDVLSVAVRGGFVYTIAGGQVIRAPKDGGDVEVLAVAPNADDVAVDDEAVYWTEPNSAYMTYVVGRMPLP